jgi:hypothetical protein
MSFKGATSRLRTGLERETELNGVKEKERKRRKKGGW